MHISVKLIHLFGVIGTVLCTSNNYKETKNISKYSIKTIKHEIWRLGLSPLWTRRYVLKNENFDKLIITKQWQKNVKCYNVVLKCRVKAQKTKRNIQFGYFNQLCMCLLNVMFWTLPYSVITKHVFKTRKQKTINHRMEWTFHINTISLSA